MTALAPLIVRLTAQWAGAASLGLARARYRFFLATTIGALSCLGCGASIQSIYEGNVRFEHCYRLDLEGRAPSDQLRTCWEHWVDNHSADQPRDRLEHARLRILSLSSAHPTRPHLQIEQPETQAIDGQTESATEALVSAGSQGSPQTTGSNTPVPKQTQRQEPGEPAAPSPQQQETPQQQESRAERGTQ